MQKVNAVISYSCLLQKRQKIATTHDIHLLDLELIRQDEIWFVKRRGIPPRHKKYKPK